MDSPYTQYGSERSKMGSEIGKKKAWKMLRMTLFMIRRCLLKRRNLVELRGKVFAKIFRGLMPASPRGFGLREYEFSCSNSPVTPALRHFANKMRRRNFFPCIRPDRSFEDKYESPRFLANFSSTIAENFQICENTGGGTEEENNYEDREAEEFIARFYNQMKFQRQISLLQYEEMLARGAN